MNHELSRLVALWEGDAPLFEPDQLLRRVEVLDLLDRHLPGGSVGASDAAEFTAVRRRVEEIRARIEAANEDVYRKVRAEIRRGQRPGLLLRWAQFARSTETASENADGYGSLDELISGVLGFEEPDDVPAQMDAELVAYQPTPARHIFDLIDAAELTADDLLVDLGSGLGHVPLLVSICTPARCIGIEREAAYVHQARRCAEGLNLRRVEFAQQDAREADLSAGTVIYLYTPFTGSVLRAVLDRLRDEACVRPIRICSYGPCTPVLAQEPWLEAATETSAHKVALFHPRMRG